MPSMMWNIAFALFGGKQLKIVVEKKECVWTSVFPKCEILLDFSIAITNMGPKGTGTI